MMTKVYRRSTQNLRFVRNSILANNTDLGLLVPIVFREGVLGREGKAPAAPAIPAEPLLKGSAGASPSQQKKIVFC